MKSAILTGILLGIEKLNPPNSFEKLLRFGDEEVYEWVKKDNVAYPQGLLVSKRDNVIEKTHLWKTFGNALRISIALIKGFEFYPEYIEYIYLNDFNIDNISITNDYITHEQEYFSKVGGLVFLKEDLINISTLLELLLRDDKFHSASNNLLQAFENHWYCMHCAFEEPEKRMHENHEPEQWEFIDILPRLEIAILQSSKTVEAILGKPGKRESPRKVYDLKENWKNIIGTDPEELFELKNQRYIDYYYYLFEMRNSSAHNLGRINFDLERKKAIEAQCFANEILLLYWKKNKKDAGDAIKILDYNKSLLDIFNKKINYI